MHNELILFGMIMRNMRRYKCIKKQSSYPLEEVASSIINGQGIPQNPHLILVFVYALPYDWFNFLGCYFVGIVGYQFTQFIPELN